MIHVTYSMLFVNIRVHETLIEETRRQ